MKDEDRKLLADLAKAAQAAFSNAEDLFREAILLRKAGCASRALFLHQISMEECGKVELIGGWAAGLLMGEPRDFKILQKALASHQAKNTANAYLLAPDEAERAAGQRGDWKERMVAFDAAKKEFHKTSNEAKNAALYVDIREGGVTTPKESISAEMIADISGQNEQYLGHMYHKVDMLAKWAKDPTVIAPSLKELKAQLEKIKDEQPDDRMKAFMSLIDAMIVAAADKSKAKSGSDPVAEAATRGCKL